MNGASLTALVKFVDSCGLKTILITSGYEAKGHSKNSYHGKNLAIDVAGKRFNKLTHTKVRSATTTAGFIRGVYENFKGTKKDHWHLQIVAENGLGSNQALKSNAINTKITETENLMFRTLLFVLLAILTTPACSECTFKVGNYVNTGGSEESTTIKFYTNKKFTLVHKT